MIDYKDTDKVTRLEVISTENGREFVKHNINIVDMLLQDNNKTLKIFIGEKGDIKW